jgi:cytochrome P450
MLKKVPLPLASFINHIHTGPITRISPYGLHIDDPDYYDELYSQHKPRNKYQFFVNQLGLYGSAFATVDHRLHRIRRAAVNPFFSKQAVARLEPMLNFMIEKFCRRIEEHRKLAKPMPIRRAYMCLATDIITLYALI